MLAQPQLALYSLTMYYNEKVMTRNNGISDKIRRICSVIRDILKEVESMEQRFSSTLIEEKETGRFLGVG